MATKRNRKIIVRKELCDELRFKYKYLLTKEQITEQITQVFLDAVERGYYVDLAKKNSN